MEVNRFTESDELKKALSVGIIGVPELKQDEKIYYLGEFRERVIKLLSKKQVAEPSIYPEIVKAIADKQADKMIINGDINSLFTKKYVKLGWEKGIRTTIIHDPSFKGDAGLVVVSSQAVEVPEIHIPNRRDRLKQFGVSDILIEAAGKKVCEKCYNKIIKIDPEEKINYRPLTFGDRFWGERCPVCQIH